MQQPKIIKGNSFTDIRGIINFNNSFDASEIKRIYTIQNSNMQILRGWQGHKVENRWFSVINGGFDIFLIAIDSWDKPSKDLKSTKYKMNSGTMDVLYVPSGYVSCIRSKDLDSKLLAMSNYGLEEINDDYKYDFNYFKFTN